MKPVTLKAYRTHMGIRINKEGRNHLKSRHKYQDIRMNLKEIGHEDVDWSYQTQDRGRWWDFVNTVMYFGSHKRQGICSLAERLLASQGLAPWNYLLVCYFVRVAVAGEDDSKQLAGLVCED
jgi:hypothetical protein